MGLASKCLPGKAAEGAAGGDAKGAASGPHAVSARKRAGPQGDDDDAHGRSRAVSIAAAPEKKGCTGFNPLRSAAVRHALAYAADASKPLINFFQVRPHTG